MDNFRIAPDSKFELPGFGSVDLTQLGGHVQRLWEHLDELAANNPDGYKAFLEQQAKAAGVDSSNHPKAASRDAAAGDFPAVVLTSTITAKSKFSKPKKPCIISFWQPLPGQTVKPAKTNGKKLTSKSKLAQPLDIPMQLRRPHFQARGEGGEHEVFELVVHPDVLDLTVQGQPEGLLGVLSHMGLLYLHKSVGLDIDTNNCKVKVMSAKAWHNKQKLEQQQPPFNPVHQAASANRTQSRHIPVTEAAKGTSLESLPSSLLQQLTTLAAPGTAAPHSPFISDVPAAAPGSEAQDKNNKDRLKEGPVKNQTTGKGKTERRPLIQVLKEEAVETADERAERDDEVAGCGRDADDADDCDADGNRARVLEQDCRTAAQTNSAHTNSAHTNSAQTNSAQTNSAQTNSARTNSTDLNKKQGSGVYDIDAGDTKQVRDRGNSLGGNVHSVSSVRKNSTVSTQQTGRGPLIDLLGGTEEEEGTTSSGLLDMLDTPARSSRSSRPLIQVLGDESAGPTGTAGRCDGALSHSSHERVSKLANAKDTQRRTKPFKAGFLTSKPRSSKQTSTSSSVNTMSSLAAPSQTDTLIRSSVHEYDQPGRSRSPPEQDDAAKVEEGKGNVLSTFCETGPPTQSEQQQEKVTETQRAPSGECASQQVKDGAQVGSQKCDAVSHLDCQVVEEGDGPGQRIHVTCRLPGIQRASETQLNMVTSQLLTLSYPTQTNEVAGHYQTTEIALPCSVDTSHVSAKFVKKSHTLHVYLVPSG